MKKQTHNCKRSLLAVLITVFVLTATVVAQKKMDRIERQSMHTILGTMKDQIQKKYYDPEYHGINLDARFELAKARLDEVTTTAQAMTVIAQVLLDFDDSHLFFLPPLTNLDVEYGYRTTMVGEKCIVYTVMPKSDAEKKGLKKGDQLLSIHGFRPDRKNMWKINYLFNSLSKQGIMNLVVLKPGAEKPVNLEVKAKVDKRSRVITEDNLFMLFDTTGETQIDWNIFTRFGNVGYWKLPSFGMSPDNINSLFGRIGDAGSVIVDLRGNGGGAVVTLERLASFFFDKDLLIATPKGRDDFDLMESKSHGGDVFKGKLVVLIDSRSASASEIFARTVQLEKRGIVMGDVSSGAVMMSRQFPSTLGNDSVFYGASITIADVIMPDGKSLEHVGVTPDQLVLPTAADVAADRDPVLAAAVKYLGGNVSAKDAGGMFEYKWDRNNRPTLKPVKN